MTKSYNYAAKLGDDMDDNELVQRYGLDPRVAYTPAINAAVRKAVYQENIADLVEAGHSVGQAHSMAGKTLKEAERVAAEMDRMK